MSKKKKRAYVPLRPRFSAGAEEKGTSEAPRSEAPRVDSRAATPPDQVKPPRERRSARIPDRNVLVVLGVLLVTFLWAYWPTLCRVVAEWSKEPDYSHGFLVVPLSAYFLWVRREGFPGWGHISWLGLIPLGLSVALRAAGAIFFVDAIDGWSIVLWITGVVWLLGGARLFGWAWPAVVFLLFAVPLPFRAERMASGPLQTIAAKMSCWTLQTLGYPSISEGNTIRMGDLAEPLEVERACSGLRIFMGILALAFAYVVLVRRSIWIRILLLLSVVPIALVANVGRIVGTGILLNMAETGWFSGWLSASSLHTLIHDGVGFVMIPFAAGLFALVLWYLTALVRDAEQLDIRATVRKAPLEA